MPRVTKKLKPEPFDLVVVKQETTEGFEEAQANLAIIKRVVINTPAEFQVVNKTLKEIKKKHKAETAKKNRGLGPLKISIKEITSWFKPYLDTLKTMEDILKDAIVVYDAKVEAEKTKAMEDLQTAKASGDTEKFDKALAVVRAEPKTEAKGLSFREDWLFEITDREIIPSNFWIPDVKAIGALVSAQKEDCQIPGIRTWMKKTPISRKDP